MGRCPALRLLLMAIAAVRSDPSPYAPLPQPPSAIDQGQAALGTDMDIGGPHGRVVGPPVAQLSRGVVQCFSGMGEIEASGGIGQCRVSVFGDHASRAVVGRPQGSDDVPVAGQLQGSGKGGWPRRGRGCRRWRFCRRTGRRAQRALGAGGRCRGLSAARRKRRALQRWDARGPGAHDRRNAPMRGCSTPSARVFEWPVVRTALCDRWEEVGRVVRPRSLLGGGLPGPEFSAWPQSAIFVVPNWAAVSGGRGGEPLVSACRKRSPDSARSHQTRVPGGGSRRRATAARLASQWDTTRLGANRRRPACACGRGLRGLDGRCFSIAIPMSLLWSPPRR